LPLLLAGIAAGQPASAQLAAVAKAVVDAMCERSKEVWTEAETVDEGRGPPSYDTTYTQCDFEFVHEGRWFSFRYDHRLRVSRRWAWREEYRALTVFILHTDSADAQNGERLLTQAIEDRGARGRASFGVSGTYGGTESIEHFCEPPDPALDEDHCVAEACARVGGRYSEDWQRRYRDALLRAHARLLLPLSNIIRAKEMP
jgi:hypothetical protein